MSRLPESPPKIRQRTPPLGLLGLIMDSPSRFSPKQGGNTQRSGGGNGFGTDTMISLAVRTYIRRYLVYCRSCRYLSRCTPASLGAFKHFPRCREKAAAACGSEPTCYYSIPSAASRNRKIPTYMMRYTMLSRITHLP